ncbi:hypothetical protein L3Y34_001826 [Caenorhabditis briggsae]|uniref:Major sperm protein n=1 Tax=Caenorhabditis briggsae TaxID=6238 RepID=A0AAE9DDT1_CAEBR|nr:hypothetical protein L3Y34_001826 [Caenorhabditis briggsae]
MAQSVPPGDIQTQPNAKIVFNAPYDDKHTYHIKVINSSARRIGYGIKTTNMKRLGVDPPCGVLDPKEAVLLAVSCDAFAYGQEDTNNDRITVEWTNTPDGAAKQFRREWPTDGFQRLTFLPKAENQKFSADSYRSGARNSVTTKPFTVSTGHTTSERNSTDRKTKRKKNNQEQLLDWTVV